MSIRQSILYIDLDGVLADLEKKSKALFGDDWKKEMEKPNWGDFQLHPRLFLDLDMMPDAWMLLNFAFDLRPVVVPKVLTALPKRGHFEFAAADKREWVTKTIGHTLPVLFGPYAEDKQYHCQPGDILIDDNELNVEQWRNRGGDAVLHTSAKSSIDETLQFLLERYPVFNVSQKWSKYIL
jgi:hypothetical protein